jgi:FSR family fosmidomycin resistance protein-like MFS transporter
MLGPALAGLAALGLGWRGVLVLVGVLGIAFSLAVLPARRWLAAGGVPAPLAGSAAEQGETAAANSGTREVGPTSSYARAFVLLAAIGVLDAATRGAGLTFLPFVLEARGLDAGAISLLFAVIFAGGAAGKFLCGWVGDRFGGLAVVWATEATTALALVLFLLAPPLAALPLALVFGFALNGTSSVLYAAVARVVPTARQARGYGLYYTATQLASALAPLFYGLLGDVAGLGILFGAMAACTVAILPVSLALRRCLA